MKLESLAFACVTHASIKDVGDFLTKRANVGWVYDELTKK
jgi:hypothetical protein